MPPKRSNLPMQEFQQYLEALSSSSETVPGERARALLFSYAEVQFRLRGGSKCSNCSSTVRHGVKVRIEGRAGGAREYDCLCTRCLEGERPLASRIVLSLGELSLEVFPKLKIMRAPPDWETAFKAIGGAEKTMRGKSPPSKPPARN